MIGRLPGGWWPEIIVAALLCGGVTMVGVGSQLPLFHNEALAGEAFGRACTLDQDVVDHWWLAVDGQRTWREFLLNAGCGLILLAATGEFLRWALLVPSGRGWPYWRTPQATWIYFALGYLALACLFFGTVVGLELDQQRFHFPPCADSIGIPVEGMMILTIILALVSTLVGLVLLPRSAALPVPLRLWAADRPIRSWIVSLVAGVLLLACIDLIIESAISSNFGMVPGLVLSLYLLAATRAALLAPKASAHSWAEAGGGM